MSIGNQISAIRKEQQLTQEHFGELFHVTRQTVSNWENEKSYPDLQIHRIIKENLRGGLNEKRTAHYDKLLTGVSVQTSAMERRADEAERETVKMKKCEYMAGHIGEVFDVVISGVTNWGLYVELPNTVEGLIRVGELKDDYYHFDEKHLELIGDMTRKVYKLGQPIRVMVTGTDKLARTIDFIPASNESGERACGFI